MNKQQISRFKQLSAKVIATKASPCELHEFKVLLTALNSLVNVNLPKAVNNFNNIHDYIE